MNRGGASSNLCLNVLKYLSVFTCLAQYSSLCYCPISTNKQHTNLESPLTKSQSVQQLAAISPVAAGSFCENKLLRNSLPPHHMSVKHQLFQNQLPPAVIQRAWDRFWVEHTSNVTNFIFIIAFTTSLVSFTTCLSFSHFPTPTTDMQHTVCCFCIANKWESAWRYDPCSEQLTNNRKPIPLFSEAQGQHHFLSLGADWLKWTPHPWDLSLCMYALCIETGSGRVQH